MQKNFPLSKFYLDYKKFDTSKVDLVVISTPTNTHYKLAGIFLKYTNVLIEKPLVFKYTQCLKFRKNFKKI